VALLVYEYRQNRLYKVVKVKGSAIVGRRSKDKFEAQATVINRLRRRLWNGFLKSDLPVSFPGRCKGSRFTFTP